MSRWSRALVLALVVLLVVPAPALAVVQGEPNLTVGLSDDTVRPGETATLSVVVANDADLKQASTSNPALNQQVTTARSVEVSVGDEGPISVRTGTHLVGSIPDGTAVTLPFAVNVRADARPGTYEVPVEMTYTYTSQVSELIGAAQRNTETVTRTLTVRVESAPVFRVVGTDADLHAGETGPVSVTVENVGRTAAADAQFTLRSPDPTLSPSEGATRFADRWAPGERRTLSYTVTAADAVRSAPYSLELVPTYRDDAGRIVTPGTLLVGVTPDTGSRFTVVEVTSSAVAEGPGTVELTVRNDGGTVLREASVRLTADGGLTVDGARTGTRFLGTWRPDELRTLTYDVRAGPDTAGGTYILDAAVGFTDADGARATTRSVPVGVEVAPVPDVRIVSVESEAVVDGSGLVSLTLRNAGDRTVSGATVTFAAPGAGVTVDGGQSGTRFAGNWTPGETRTVAYDVRTAPGVAAGTYTFTTAVGYADGGRVTGPAIPVGVEVAGPPTFTVEAVESDAVTGGSGTVALTLRNTADRTLSGATVELTAPGTGLAVDGGQAGTRFVGTWAPGETRTVRYDLQAAPTTAAGTYTLSAAVGYESGTATVAARPFRVGVSVADPVAFDVTDLSGDLYVGERGVLSGTVTNDGDRPARNALVVLGGRSPHVSFPEGAVSVGDLSPGESASFAVDTDVGAGATAGDRSFSLTVEYEADDGSARTSDAVSFTRSVGADREPLGVDPVSATFQPDSSGRLAVNVTNTGTEPREAITLRIVPSAPLTSAAPEAYVERLAPGESTEVAFELTVDEDAVPSSLSVALNVTSEIDGGTPATDTYRLPVTIAQEPSGAADITTVVAAVGLAIALFVGVAYWWLNR